MATSDRVSKVGAQFTDVNEIAFRFDGAVHFYQILEEKYYRLLNRPIAGTGQDIKELHWFFHGYCFELVATFECALQVLSAYYQLGIPRREISWQRCSDALREMEIENDFTKILGEISASDWFQELKDRRNYVAHRSSAFIQALIADDEVKEFKILGRIGLSSLEDELEKMRPLVDLSWNTIPEGDIAYT